MISALLREAKLQQKTKGITTERSTIIKTRKPYQVVGVGFLY
jgi:hypothetical protein